MTKKVGNYLNYSRFRETHFILPFLWNKYMPLTLFHNKKIQIFEIYICNFQNYFFWNIKEFGRSKYFSKQYLFDFIHYLKRYGHFQFDIKTFCAFYIIILFEN